MKKDYDYWWHAYRNKWLFHWFPPELDHAACRAGLRSASGIYNPEVIYPEPDTIPRTVAALCAKCLHEWDK